MPTKCSICKFLKDTSDKKIYSGFSLIELVIVVSIMALLFVAGMANYRDFARRKSLEAVVTRVKSDLEQVQAYAISGVKPNIADCASPNRLIGFFFRMTSQYSYQLEVSCSGSGPRSIKLVNLSTEASGYTINMARSTCTPVGAMVSVSSILFKILGKGTDIPSGSCIYVNITQTQTGNVGTITVRYSGEIR